MDSAPELVGATAGAGPPSPGVAVFDLDATLVAGDSMAAYLRHRLTLAVNPLLRALLLAPAWAPALLTVHTRRAGQRALVRLAVRDLDAGQLQRSVEDFAEEYVTAREQAHPQGVAAVNGHLAAGDRVLVATECLDVLAQALCDAMGVGAGPGVVGGVGVEVVAEELVSGGLQQYLRTRAHYKEAKVDALVAAGVVFPVDDAYSDSVADLPLLRRARAAHVINAGRLSRRRFRRALGTRLDERVWTPGGAGGPPRVRRAGGWRRPPRAARPGPGTAR